jgi:hypothetical protein
VIRSSRYKYTRSCEALQQTIAEFAARQRPLRDHAELEERLAKLEREATNIKAMQEALQHKWLPIALNLVLTLLTEQGNDAEMRITNFYGCSDGCHLLLDLCI